jgi:DNA primase
MRFSPRPLNELCVRPTSAVGSRHVDLHQFTLTGNAAGDCVGRWAHHGAAGGAADGYAMRGELGRRGVAELVERIERAITVPAVWGARPDAAPADVVMTWNQLFALHRQWHSLIKELKDAEQALGRDTTEANYTWLQDVKARLSEIEGTEALVEGFGASSGRGASGF